MTQFWLATTFQNTIQTSLHLSKKYAPQQTPYVHKYTAIQQLKSLLNKQHDYKFIVYVILGDIYNQVDQLSDSVKSYQKALISVSELIKNGIKNIFMKFGHYILIIYNMLGLSYINRQQTNKGIGCLAKAIDIYEQIIKKNQGLQNKISYYNNRAQNIPNDSIYKYKFSYYFQGGLNLQQLQEYHTLSLFYLAQAYTKLGLKDQAAQTCGLTLQRQYATGKYQINDFCNNLISLASYYQSKGYFAQGVYILMLAMQVLPKDLTKKKKMRASVQIAIGQLEGKIMQKSIDNIKNKKTPQQIATQNKKSNKQLLKFNSFIQKFPQVNLANDIQQIKSFFRKANTQFKKALQIYILDGYVTQHIQILFNISKLYFNLSKIQTSRQKVCAMLQKRRQTLQPLLKQLSSKVYPATWQRVLVETSQIYNDLFQLRTIMAIDVKPGKAISPQKIKLAVNLGDKLINYYHQIIAQLQNDRDAQRNAQYYRSIVNSKFNIAKTYSKMYSYDIKERVSYLKASLDGYEQLSKFIKSTKMVQQFSQQLMLTQDMINMLPSKINRINYGQVSPFQ